MEKLAVLALILHVALGQFGHLGYMLGIQEVCEDPLCQKGHMSLLNYTFPPPGVNKGTVVTQVTPSFTYEIIQDLERYNAYDATKRLYYLLTDIDDGPTPEYTLYTISIDQAKVLSSVIINGTVSQVYSIECDSSTGALFGVFGVNMFLINPTTGAVTNRGPISGGESILLTPTLVSAFDVATGTYFIYCDDNTHGTQILINYYTRNNSLVIGSPINSTDIIDPDIYGMDWYPAANQLVAQVRDLGVQGHLPSMQLINPVSGWCTDFVSEEIWKDYYLNYGYWPLSPFTNQITVFDPVLNIFWATFNYLDLETEANDDALLYYNFTKGGLMMSSGPMVIYINAIEFTNYVWFPAGT